MTHYSEADISAAMTVKLDDVLPEKRFFKKVLDEHQIGDFD